MALFNADIFEIINYNYYIHSYSDVTILLVMMLNSNIRIENLLDFRLCDPDQLWK